MKVIDHFHELDDCTLPIVTSGTFDGVHSGHFKILNGLVKQAQDRGGESVVITYWPHPRFVLGMGSSSLKLLSTFDEKVKLMSDIEVRINIPPTRNKLPSNKASILVSKRSPITPTGIIEMIIFKINCVESFHLNFNNPSINEKISL